MLAILSSILMFITYKGLFFSINGFFINVINMRDHTVSSIWWENVIYFPLPVFFLFVTIKLLAFIN